MKFKKLYVCIRCNVVLDNLVDHNLQEHYHKTTFANGDASHCLNAGKGFLPGDVEVKPFVPKKKVAA